MSSIGFNGDPIVILTLKEAKYILACLPDFDDIGIKIREKCNEAIHYKIDLCKENE